MDPISHPIWQPWLQRAAALSLTLCSAFLTNGVSLNVARLAPFSHPIWQPWLQRNRVQSGNPATPDAQRLGAARSTVIDKARALLPGLNHNSGQIVRILFPLSSSSSSPPSPLMPCAWLGFSGRLSQSIWFSATRADRGQLSVGRLSDRRLAAESSGAMAGERPLASNPRASFLHGQPLERVRPRPFLTPPPPGV